MPRIMPLTFYTWWTQRFHAAIEGFGEANARGLRRSFREGGHLRVYPLEVLPGEIVAQAPDRYKLYYTVRIRARALPETVWQGVADALADEPGQLSALLARIPNPALERIVTDAGGWLFPRGPADFEATCTCFQRSQGYCAHIAATVNAFCQRIEQDPALLLTLWGCPRERLVALVRGRWEAAIGGESASREKERAAGLPARVAPTAFFGPTHALPTWEPAMEPPRTEMAVLMRMGRPPFAVEAEDIAAALAPLYALVTRRAIQTWERGMASPSRHPRRPRRRPKG